MVAASVGASRAIDPARPVDLDATEPLVVVGDSARLRQVMDNLLANAREHTPPGTAVEVRLGRENGHAVVDVMDHGPGIPAEDRARVFERFYRADRARSRDHGGVGLGLAIVSSVCQAQGGHVSYVAAPHGGARFRISLPLPPEEEHAGALEDA